MTRKLIDCYYGVRPYDDRDHYGNKRVDTAGALLALLFSSHFIKLIRNLKQSVLGNINAGEKIESTIKKVIQGCNIDSKIKYGLATGNWATNKSNMTASNKGIAQVLNRMSYQGALSHKRRIQSPLERAGSKIFPPRRLHSTHYGMCCPNETPEGQQIGITKNLALQTHVTIQTNDYPVRIALIKLGVLDVMNIATSQLNGSTKILVNGDFFGIMPQATTALLYQRLKTLKRHGIIVPYISIAWFIDWQEIHIRTDGRPLLSTSVHC